jgi:uncharacterized membrane protein
MNTTGNGSHDHRCVRAGIEAGEPFRRMQRAATIAASLVAALSISAVTTGTATAEPKDPPGVADYYSCLGKSLDGYNRDHSQISDRDFWSAAQACCAAMLGVWRSRDGSCTLPDGEQTKPSGQSGQPGQGPPPGATVILPPGVNARAGSQ